MVIWVGNGSVCHRCGETENLLWIIYQHKSISTKKENSHLLCLAVFSLTKLLLQKIIYFHFYCRTYSLNVSLSRSTAIVFLNILKGKNRDNTESEHICGLRFLLWISIWDNCSCHGKCQLPSHRTFCINLSWNVTRLWSWPSRRNIWYMPFHTLQLTL